MGKRGQKTCPECSTINGVRSFECKKCKHTFNVKRKLPKVVSVQNWRELRPGQEIKVLGRSGPYYLDPDGIKHYYAESGCIYRVHSLDKCGINAFEPSGGPYTYLYMGKEEKSELCKNYYRSPHRLLIKNPQLTGHK